MADFARRHMLTDSRSASIVAHVVALSYNAETADPVQSQVSRTLLMRIDVLEGANLVGGIKVYLSLVDRDWDTYSPGDERLLLAIQRSN